MRILFYLPAVTPWWFEHIILPLVEKLVVDHEVHILAPVLWSGTGLSQRELDLCQHLPQVNWHVVSDKDHPSMRTNAVQRAPILDFVRQLDPDFVLARTADFETLEGFPGIVRHITEGGADPLILPAEAVCFTKTPFDHGVLPPLGEDQRSTLDHLIEPYWQAFVNAPEAQLPAQSAFRQWADLPYDRPTLFLPLEYENEENFYSIHRKGSTPNVALVEECLAQLDGRAFLVLTNHPLNDLYVDNSALEQLAESNQGQVRLLSGETPSKSRTTRFMMRAADGVLLGDSKCYSLAGLCGTPIYRQTRFSTGEWLNASTDLDAFVTAVRRGNAARPDAATARIWFAYHAANNLVSPNDPGLTGADLLDRLTNPFSPARWEQNLDLFAQSWQRDEDMAA